MKVKLYKKLTIENFALDHANSRKLCIGLLNSLLYADWAEPRDITQTIKGNLIGSERVVFDLGGNGRNAYRVICKYIFKPFKKRVNLYVCWMGTHEQYNRLTNDDKLTIWEY